MIELLCAITILCVGIALGIAVNRLLAEVKLARAEARTARCLLEGDAGDFRRIATKLPDLERIAFALDQDLATLWKTRADKRYGQRKKDDLT